MPQTVAIVTGTARGICKKIAMTLARRGTAVLKGWPNDSVCN